MNPRKKNKVTSTKSTDSSLESSQKNNSTEVSNTNQTTNTQGVENSATAEASQVVTNSSAEIPNNTDQLAASNPQAVQVETPDTSDSSQVVESSATTDSSQAVPNSSVNTSDSETTTTSQSDQTSNTWASMDEAIQFYEATYKNPENELSQYINWTNYNRSCWSLVSNSGAKITLHWANIGGAGGSYCEFIKDGDNTIIKNYDGNASYPGSPTSVYTISNDGYREK